LIGGRKDGLQIEADLDVNNLIAQFAKGDHGDDNANGNGEAFAQNVLDDLIAAQKDTEGDSQECPICLEIMDPPMIVPKCMHRMYVGNTGSPYYI
jgi:DNA repair protein RAD5